MCSPDLSDFPDAERIAVHANAYAAGDDSRADALCGLLRGPVAGSIRTFPLEDKEDVVQETLVAVLGHLRRAGRDEGNLVRLAVAIARNRCRDILRWRRRVGSRHQALEPLAAWIADPARNPLDDLLQEEVTTLARAALASLDRECRELLSAFYLRDESMEDIRNRIGLDTVQGVYYRRTVCLRQALAFLNDRMAVRSKGESR